MPVFLAQSTTGHCHVPHALCRLLQPNLLQPTVSILQSPVVSCLKLAFHSVLTGLQDLGGAHCSNLERETSLSLLAVLRLLEASRDQKTHISASCTGCAQ